MINTFNHQTLPLLLFCGTVVGLWAGYRADMVLDRYGRKLHPNFGGRLAFVVLVLGGYLALFAAFRFSGSLVKSLGALPTVLDELGGDQAPLLAVLALFGLYSFEPFRQIERELLAWLHRAHRQLKNGIFISYRRGDESGVAGRLRDYIATHVPEAPVFMDVDSMRPGTDFVQELDDQIARAGIFFVLIGPNWADARNSKGSRRLDEPSDFVRLEVASALKQNKVVVPVLVNGAHMPNAEELPGDLQPLVRRSAIELRHTRFSGDADEITREARDRLGLPVARR